MSDSRVNRSRKQARAAKVAAIKAQPEPMLPRGEYTVRKTWHHGNDCRVTEHTGPFILDAIAKAAPDMPDAFMEEALTALRNGEPYRSWSWMTLELASA